MNQMEQALQEAGNNHFVDFNEDDIRLVHDALFSGPVGTESVASHPLKVERREMPEVLRGFFERHGTKTK